MSAYTLPALTVELIVLVASSGHDDGRGGGVR